METTHTPGPWRVVTGKNISVGPVPGRHVAVCNYDNGSIEKANAQLIAAAPDLLQALRGLRAAMAGYVNTPEEMRALDTAKAAITKATDGG